MKKIRISATYQPDFSGDYYCIHSTQNLNSDYDTNVFASNVPIKQLLKNRDIILVDDLRGDSRWGMNKIIQRNISSKRVEEIKKEYLEASNRAIKFFPAITVVLLPKTLGEPKQFYEKTDGNFDNIKGFKVKKTYEGDDFIMNYPVSIKWDKNNISALVIDGQHRISAIREYYDGKNEAIFENVSIPVSFVVFKNIDEVDLIQATRALFIDVNNTPRLVSEEKLIFIDDRNIQRRITSRALGANDPGDNSEDVYQKMLNSEDYLLTDESFINRYFIEESGKDDEERRGFLLNHRSLFPWEVSNIMTIHNNILGGILLKYLDFDKTRDIRSICTELNSTILDEIESMQAVVELDDNSISTIQGRLSTSGLSDNEIELFNNLMLLKKQNLEEVQQTEKDFIVGFTAEPEEQQDLIEFRMMLKNLYNQDCSKDSAFELRGSKISNLLNEKCSIYMDILIGVFNGLWFSKEIKDSILLHKDEDLKLIFNFLVSTHESLKVSGGIRSRADKVDRQITNFFKDDENPTSEKISVVKNWAKKLEKTQNICLLRTIVGQEMLFMFIIGQTNKLSTINIEETIEFINSLGSIGFFNNDTKIELEFLGEDSFKIVDFNPWSEIIMAGGSMKPGVANARKGSELISFVKNNYSNRITAPNLMALNRLQKAYGAEILKRFESDPDVLFLMYNKAKVAENISNYLTDGEIATISETFENGLSITPKATNVIGKVFGAIALEKIIGHFQ